MINDDFHVIDDFHYRQVVEDMFFGIEYTAFDAWTDREDSSVFT